MSIFELSRKEGRVWEISQSEIKIDEQLQYDLYSRVDKHREIKAVLDRIDFSYHKNFFIFGIKNMELITEIYKRKTSFSTMVVIEITGEDVLYIDGKSECNKLFNDPRVNMIIGKETDLIEQLDFALRDMLKLYNLRNTEVITMPYVKSTCPQELQNVINILFERLHSSIAGFGNSVEDILWGMDNYINNWRHLLRGLDYGNFENLYSGKPAIIVGAGPSLDKNADLLKELKGKALIFAVDAAMDTLLEKGITPDAVSSIERTEITCKFYKGDVIPDDIVYIGPNVVFSEILDRFKRIVFTGRKGDGFFQDFNKNIGYGNMEIGMNVSHIPFSFARLLGCDPIIFVGLDLAYTGGRTHTSKVEEGLDDDLKSVYKRDVVYVKGQNGEKLETFEFFMHTRVWIERQILNDKTRKFINATEGGANIDGACNMKLSEVISQYWGNEADLEALNIAYDKCAGGKSVDKLDVTAKAEEFYTRLIVHFEKVANQAKEYHKQLGSYKKRGKVDLIQKLRVSLDELMNESLAAYFILQSITISYTRDMHSFPMYLDKENEEKMLNRSLDYFDTIDKVCRKVIETLEIYKDILKTNMEMMKNEGGKADGIA